MPMRDGGGQGHNETVGHLVDDGGDGSGRGCDWIGERVVGLGSRGYRGGLGLVLRTTPHATPTAPTPKPPRTSALVPRRCLVANIIAPVASALMPAQPIAARVPGDAPERSALTSAPKLATTTPAPM